MFRFSMLLPVHICSPSVATLVTANSFITTGNLSRLQLFKITRCPAHFLNQLLSNVVSFLFGYKRTVRSQ
jgi:hypothetical protein